MIFEIGPTEEVGDFEVKAKFMGVQMETFMLHYQVWIVVLSLPPFPRIVFIREVPSVDGECSCWMKNNI